MHRVLQAGRRHNNAIEDRLAVLALAQQQERRFGRRRNIVALRINQIDRVRLVADLAAQQKRGFGIEITLQSRFAELAGLTVIDITQIFSRL